MAARINECIQFTVTVTRDDDGLPPDMRREIVVLARDLALMRQINPVAFEYVLHLQLEDLRIGEDVAIYAIDPVRRVVLHRRVERFPYRPRRRLLLL